MLTLHRQIPLELVFALHSVRNTLTAPRSDSDLVYSARDGQSSAQLRVTPREDGGLGGEVAKLHRMVPLAMSDLPEGKREDTAGCARCWPGVRRTVTACWLLRVGERVQQSTTVNLCLVFWKLVVMCCNAFPRSLARVAMLRAATRSYMPRWRRNSWACCCLHCMAARRATRLQHVSTQLGLEGAPSLHATGLGTCASAPYMLGHCPCPSRRSRPPSCPNCVPFSAFMHVTCRRQRPDTGGPGLCDSQCVWGTPQPGGHAGHHD